MKKYTTILFDADETLLDFGKDETQALTLILEKYGIETSEENIKTYKEINEDGIEKVVTKYSDMDFIEIVEIPEKLVIKSGVMIKSTVDITIPVFIGSSVYDNLTFENGGLYIIYDNGELIQTKLN